MLALDADSAVGREGMPYEQRADERSGCRKRQEPYFRMAGLPLLFQHLARQPGSVSEPAGRSGWIPTRPQLPSSHGHRRTQPTPHIVVSD
jgi:hypothetical protein